MLELDILITIKPPDLRTIAEQPPTNRHAVAYHERQGEAAWMKHNTVDQPQQARLA
jgi:hypothetical protein